MSKLKYKIGDRLVTKDGLRGNVRSIEFTVAELRETPVSHDGFYVGADGVSRGGFWESEIVGLAPIGDPDDSKPQDTAVTPAHYAFPGGIRVHQISGHLTSFGGQALQYIARSTRLDGQNKGDTAENLRKAIRFLKLEIARVEGEE